MTNQNPSDTQTVDPNATDVTVFTPVDAKPPKVDAKAKNVPRKNLAGNTELADKARACIKSHYDNILQSRPQLEEIWELADWMYKCGQDDGITQTERARVTRIEDDTKSKTLSQKVGSTLFFRQVRSISAHLVDIFDSKSMPCKVVSRRNPSVFYSSDQAELLAEQHNTLLQWTFDEEDMGIKFTNFAFQLLKEGNVPVFARWLRTSKEVKDNWPVTKEQVVNGEKKTVVVDTKRERRRMTTDNRPILEFLANECFFAYPNIGGMQKQPCVLVKSLTNITELWNGQRQNEYLNVTSVGQEHIYKGNGDSDDLASQRDLNAGLSSSIADTTLGGSILQWDAHAVLPIDETKPDGEMWNAAAHEPKIYWCTFVGDLASGKVICTRMERNLDPDDDMPFAMIHMFPGDPNRLYHMCLAQALRGNFIEQTTAKQQAIDHGTLMNNRPLIIKRGVKTSSGDLTFSKDNVFFIQDKGDVEEFELGQMPDNYQRLAWLDADSDETAGNNRTMRAEPMGSRTSSTEAQNAATSGMLPMQMIAKYVFKQMFKWYPRKAIRMWHLHAEDDQILKITDEQGVQKVVRPADLFGDFDTRIEIVHEYEKNILSQQNASWATQALLPVFASVLNLRGLAPKLFEQSMQLDVTPFLLPDKREASIQRARGIIQGIVDDGVYVAPNPDDDLNAQLPVFESARIQYRGAEENNEQIIENFDRWIETAKQMASEATKGVGSMPSPPTAETPGQASGDQIAGQLGAMA